MAKDVLERAENLFQRKKYSDVISLLEPVVLEPASGDLLHAYKQSFELYFFLGLSCLYTGDTGGAKSYFERASKIRPGNTTLMLARAVVSIMLGKVPDACGHYLEILRRDPDNRKAAKALEFLRKSNDETIRRFVAEKKIFRFCPKFKRKKSPVLIAVVAAVLLAALPAAWLLRNTTEIVPDRADLSAFVLSQDELGSATEQEGSYSYVLTSRQVISSYESIKTYFNSFRDNAAQVEINRLLNSNASASIRRKARMLMDYLSEPGFDTINDRDVYSYSQVASEPLLYMDCWVVWEGMAANIIRGENSTEFSFLVGYDRTSDLEGVVQVNFSRALAFDQERPFTLLGQIKSEDGRIVLRGSSMYQSVRPAG